MFIITFIISCTALYFSYTHTENYLKYNTEKFDRLTVDRKHYVVKNLIKGVYLALLVLFASILVIPDIIWHNKWHIESKNRIIILKNIRCSISLMNI